MKVTSFCISIVTCAVLFAVLPFSGFAQAVSPDINGDGSVTIQDLGILLSNWNTSAAVADINGDGLVSIQDLGILLSNWGQSGSTPTPTPVSGSGAYPNEPAGFVRIAEHDLSASPLWPRSTQTAIAGSWWSHPYPSDNLQSDPTAPASPNGIWRMKCPQGMQDGIACDAVFGGWDGNNTEHREVYLSMWMKLDGPTYENHIVATKLVFLASGEAFTRSGNNGYLAIQSPNTSASAFALSFRQQNVTARNMYQNADTRRLLTVGEWHHIELVGKLNDINNIYSFTDKYGKQRERSDGVLKVWIDGNLILDYDDVIFARPTNPEGFWSWKVSSIWGGNRDDYYRSETDYINFDHIYISGIPK